MATRIRSVLAAVDFENASARGVAVAGALAAAHRAQLSLIHAETIELPAYFTTGQVGTLEIEQRRIDAQAEKYLRAFGEQHTSARFDAVVDEGLPAEVVLRHAASADVVVVGTHGRRGPARWWLGSIAERVLETIDRPLVVVRGDSASPPYEAFARIVVHASAPATGDATLAFALELAQPFGGRVSDERQRPLDPAAVHTSSTLLAIAMPRTRPRAWISTYGEPLIRNCAVPMLFVPEGEEV